MSIQEIEKAITLLPSGDVARLTSWLVEYDAHIWDRQIADDLESGRLDAFLAEVEKEYQAGQAQPL